MTEGVAETIARPSKFRRGDRPQPEPETRDVVDAAYLLDVIAASVFLVSLVVCFQVRDGYASRPLVALIWPVLSFAVVTPYRRRILGRSRRLWGRIVAYSNGVGPIPWASATLFATAPAWLLYVSNGQITGVVDTLPVIPTAESLLTEGNLDLSEYLAKDGTPSILGPGETIPNCIVEAGGKPHSSYPAGMVPFALGVTGLAQLAGADLTKPQVQLRLQKLTASLVAAMCVGLFFLIALQLAPPPAASIATAILATASGMFSTVALALWQHGGIILWSMVVLLVEFQPGYRRGRMGTIAQGFACAQMITCRLTSISFLVPFFAWTFLRDPRRSLAIFGIALISYSPWAALYLSIYGGPFGPSTSSLAKGLWTTDLGTPLAGLLVSPSRGLLVYQPWVVLALLTALPNVRPGGRETAGRDGPPGWRRFALAAVACHVALISAWGCWWGGWCWGSRLVIETVPLLALLCVRPIASLCRSNWGRALTVGLALPGVLAQWPLIYSDAARWNESADLPADLWSWSRAPFLNPDPERPRPTAPLESP